ncbi:MAG: hypothetical protein ACFFCM_07930 [Promethearchaeota archaeon]
MIQTVDPDKEYKSKTEENAAIIGFIIFIVGFFIISIFIDLTIRHSRNFTYPEPFAVEFLFFAIVLCIVGILMVWGPVAVRKLKKPRS